MCDPRRDRGEPWQTVVSRGNPWLTVVPLISRANSVILTDVAPILAQSSDRKRSARDPKPRGSSSANPSKGGFRVPTPQFGHNDRCLRKSGECCRMGRGFAATGAMAKGGFRSKAGPFPDHSNPFLMSLRVDASAVGGGGLWFRRETEKASLNCSGNSRSHFYGGTVMAQCQSLTKKKNRCPIEDAWIDPTTGLFACHVHNTTGTFRQQVEASRPDRLAKRLVRKASRKGRRRRPWPPPETAPLKDQH